MKKILATLIALLMLASLSLAEGDIPPAGNYDESDRIATWDAATATTIQLAGNSATITGNGASLKDNIITIHSAGTYILSGTLEDGQIRIDAGKNDVVRLVLNGVNISCSNSSPLYAPKADRILLILAENTENTFTDGQTYQWAIGEDEPDAAIFVQDSLVILGEGSLTVEGRLRNGVAAKDDLTIFSGNLQITAVNDALRGRDSVSIAGGNLTLIAGNDGLKANNDTDPTKGWIAIDGGNFTIQAGSDGIQAETNVTVTGGNLTIQAGNDGIQAGGELTLSGGNLDILTGGGSANAPAHYLEQGWGGRNPFAMASTTETDTESHKGLKAGTALLITGGTGTLDSSDDTLHANGDVTITGGVFTLQSGDDGVHADSALLINGGILNIPTSYEGLEGATVTITGGDITLYAKDDGINAAGGNDISTQGGGFGRDFFQGNSSYYLEISGGNLTLSADGDGLDSNGSLTLSGGNITVHGPTASGNSAMDCDGTLLFHGGEILAAGSLGMAQAPNASSQQITLSLYYNSNLPAGTTLTISSAGRVLATYTAEKAFQLLQYSSPSLQIGDVLTITTSTGTTTEATLTSISTAVSETGAANTNRNQSPGRR